MQPSERNEFITEHYGLVHSCCHRFSGRGIDYEDLFQAGSIGLIKAADGFDFNRNVCFSTYAIPVILGEIRRLFRDGGTIKVSRSIRDLLSKINKEKQEFINKEGREPSINEIAELLGVSVFEVAEAVGASQPIMSLSSAESESGEEIDVCVDYRDELFDKLTVYEIRSSLCENDWKLIGIRYFKGKTQTETAKLLGMTQVQVSRRERAIINTLREKFA